MLLNDIPQLKQHSTLNILLKPFSACHILSLCAQLRGNTPLYNQLIHIEKDDEVACKVAKTPKEIQELIELGFEFVCAQDNLKFFRKRK